MTSASRRAIGALGRRYVRAARLGGRGGAALGRLSIRSARLGAAVTPGRRAGRAMTICARRSRLRSAVLLLGLLAAGLAQGKRRPGGSRHGRRESGAGGCAPLRASESRWRKEFVSLRPRGAPGRVLARCGFVSSRLFMHGLSSVRAPVVGKPHDKTKR